MHLLSSNKLKKHYVSFPSSFYVYFSFSLGIGCLELHSDSILRAPWTTGQSAWGKWKVFLISARARGEAAPPHGDGAGLSHPGMSSLPCHSAASPCFFQRGCRESVCQTLLLRTTWEHHYHALWAFSAVPLDLSYWKAPTAPALCSLILGFFCYMKIRIKPILWGEMGFPPRTLQAVQAKVPWMPALGAGINLLNQDFVHC